MSHEASVGGPVSVALEQDIRSCVGRHGIVLWLDTNDDYGSFISRLAKADKLPYEVRAYRGSYLELMLELEPTVGGVTRPSLLLHLPHFSEESVRDTPLLELYFAGKRYRKKLETLVAEAAAHKVPPETIQAFQTKQDLSLKGADAWLAEQLDDKSGGLSVPLRALSGTALIDDLIGDGYMAKRIGDENSQQEVFTRLQSLTGVTQQWRDATFPQEITKAPDLAYVGSSWAMAVEYTDDLSHPPSSTLLQTVKDLPKAVIQSCQEIAKHLRANQAETYEYWADQTQRLLPEEAERWSPEDLGDTDTFRFEEDCLLQGAIDNVQQGRFDQASRWADLRLEQHAFWPQRDPARQLAWKFVKESAALGLAIGVAGDALGNRLHLADAVERYVSKGAAVDRAHRLLEQRAPQLVASHVPYVDRLRLLLQAMRQRWQGWADQWASDFSAICKSEGFLPELALQQRSLFEQEVRPLTGETGITAYFVVDALRFEMAQTLYEDLEGKAGSKVSLKARLAELPTLTEVGMNVLAPVADGERLRASQNNDKLTGFSTGEFRVTSPDTRKRAMHDRVGGTTCPWLSLQEVLNRDSVTLKKTVAEAKLVVVHSQEIDEAGEKGVGPAIFSQTLSSLRAAYKRLRQAGVRRFVITADHGFLLLDGESQSVQRHGRKIDPQRRHVYTTVAADHDGEVRVALNQLNYDGVEGYVVFPETTAVFDRGKRAMGFVHGGNSLQERVIPVLTIIHRNAAGESLVRYRIEARATQGISGMHALAGRVRHDEQASLAFGGKGEVELSLEVDDAPDIQVELCDGRGGAHVVGGSLRVKVDEDFEVFFRLAGLADSRVRVRLSDPSSQQAVIPCVLEERYRVTQRRASVSVPAAVVSRPQDESRPWLADLPEGGVRLLFEHLAEHGAVTENEASAMLGSPRALRRFAREFETHAAKAPFTVHIEVVGGSKRYVREGAGQ